MNIDSMKQGWRLIALGDCCDIVSGSTPRRNVPEYWEGDIPWVTPKDLSTLDTPVLSGAPEFITEAGFKSCSTQMLPAGTVLFSSRAPIGLVAIANIPMCTNQGFKSLVPHKEVDSRYLYYCMKRLVPKVQSLGNGATFKEVSRSVMAKVQIPLPYADDPARSLSEQKRIADILDKADAIRRSRKVAINEFNSLAAAVFNQMFSKKLARAGWVDLSEFLEELRYGTSNKSGNGGYTTLRIPNIVRGIIDIEDLKTVDVSASEFGKLQLLDGDMLFVRTNGNPDYVGRCAVFDGEQFSKAGLPADKIIYASYLIRARLKLDRVRPVFLQSLLQTAAGRKDVRAKCRTSAGQYNINTKGIGSLQIPDIDIDDQREFEARISSLLPPLERLVAAQAESDDLFKSVVQRAFKGEL